MDSTALARVKATEGGLWLPDIGVVDRSRRELMTRLNHYDERLVLGRHEVTGDWCVFLKARANPLGTDVPYPVLGLGQELPSADEAMDKLRKYDALRNGEKLLDEINRRNEDNLKLVRDAADDAAGVVAEAAESFLHDQGKTPFHRNYRPTKKTAIRGH